MQAGRAADAGNAKAARKNFAFRLSDAFVCKCRVRRQVKIALQSAEFDCSETVLLREVQDLLHIPGRAAQSRKRNRQARRFASGRKCGSYHCAR